MSAGLIVEALELGDRRRRLLDHGRIGPSWRLRRADLHADLAAVAEQDGERQVAVVDQRAHRLQVRAGSCWAVDRRRATAQPRTRRARTPPRPS